MVLFAKSNSLISNGLVVILQPNCLNSFAEMTTPINKRVHRGAVKCDDDFHAGHFLRDILQETGHDVPWLAQRTGREMAFLESLLEQSNMDAELFVRIGMPMQPLFMQRVDEMIFGKQKKVDYNK